MSTLPIAQPTEDMVAFTAIFLPDGVTKIEYPSTSTDVGQPTLTDKSTQDA